MVFIDVHVGYIITSCVHFVFIIVQWLVIWYSRHEFSSGYIDWYDDFGNCYSWHGALISITLSGVQLNNNISNANAWYIYKTRGDTTTIIMLFYDILCKTMWAEAPVIQWWHPRLHVCTDHIHSIIYTSMTQKQLIRCKLSITFSELWYFPESECFQVIVQRYLLSGIFSQQYW